MSSNVEFWQVRYQEGQTPWDIGQVAPPFIGLLQQYANELPPGKMAALGSGYGHDAAYFGQQGFEVVGFDYVPEAITAANRQYGQWAKFVQSDIYSLDQAYNDSFDYVLEHTCFCAIPPASRLAYVQVVQRLLKPGGYFIGLIWAAVEPDGPPYPSTQEELETLFQDGFEIKWLAPAESSIAHRRGQELLCLFRRKTVSGL